VEPYYVSWDTEVTVIDNIDRHTALQCLEKRKEVGKNDPPFNGELNLG
jgi:hypothetical protein